mmetsp:Transcript_3660/g.6743  ORF Transcript_3660/g.6743 Transcript_3660/m.6743 type:complete len:93 (+) Transcript_3660:1073-1351(+)
MVRPTGPRPSICWWRTKVGLTFRQAPFPMGFSSGVLWKPCLWDGTTWTPTSDFTDITSQGGFAVAFEAISGEAMLVYSLKKGSRVIRKWHSP